MKDVASDASVSIATVSRVLHGQPVRADMRERVLASVARLQYKPNLAAQSMRTRSSRMVACALRGVMMPEMSLFVRSAESVFRKAGYNLLLTGLDESADYQRDFVQLLASRGIDGILLTPASVNAEALDEVIGALAAPVVVIDRDTRAGAGLVAVDHAGGIRQAVDHLVSLGHRKIGLLTISGAIRPGRERIEAFHKTMQAHGLEVLPAQVSDRNLLSENCFYEASLMLTGRQAPTALIAGGMSLLPGVLRAADSAGLQIGRDLAVIAGSDSDLAALKSPGITAIRWDLAQWGSMAARMLLEMIEGPGGQEAPSRVVLPTELVVRASCQRL